MQADSLMYHLVYADLVVLAKSKELHKSVFDMRLELKLFHKRLFLIIVLKSLYPNLGFIQKIQNILLQACL